MLIKIRMKYQNARGMGNCDNYSSSKHLFCLYRYFRYFWFVCLFVYLFVSTFWLEGKTQIKAKVAESDVSCLQKKKKIRD